MQHITKMQLIRCFEKMVMIRKVEEKLMDVFFKGEILGMFHVCIGQEAAPVAVCAHLDDSDYMFSTHRGHGHALAKGIDLTLFMAEFFGKKNGLCKGRSGSMHMADHKLGIMGANGIVGGGIPIATGAAFASWYKKKGQVAVCFFGEGASDEGTFHESLNIASLKSLPIVYICENNGWAQFTPQESRVRNVADRASAYNIPSITIPNDFYEIYNEAAKAVKRAREGNGPSLLEVKSIRWHGHFVGDAQKYRPEKDIGIAREEDCIKNFENRLIEENVIEKQVIQQIEEKIDSEIEKTVEFARKSTFSDDSELMEGVYV